MNVIRPDYKDDHKLWQDIANAWGTGEPFAVIEAMVSGEADVLAGFEACPDPWCFNSYEIPRGAHAYEPVNPRCAHESGPGASNELPAETSIDDVVDAHVLCLQLLHDHRVEEEDGRGPVHPFNAIDASCQHCGKAEHAPDRPVQIADIGGFAIGCCRFRPAGLVAAFDHELLALPTHWANVDVHLTVALKSLGLIPHRHMPNVER